MKQSSGRQMSESFLTAAFLSISGGLQDAYTYICRGEVFANAQTGNIVLLSQCIANRDLELSIHYIVPLLFFAVGIAVAEIIHGKFKEARRLHWRQLVLIIEIAFGRHFLGLGTIVNAVFLGYICTFFYNIFTETLALEPTSMLQSLIILCVGVIICCLGLSMYQMPDQGVAPYDSLSLIMAERWPRIPYFWCRISNDALCALVCYLAGGIIGIGTLVTAFGLGPVIHFFNKHFTGPLLKKI